MSQAGAIDGRTLPPQMRRILRAIGVSATWQLLRWRGGRRMKLPRDSSRSEIVDIIGVDGLDALLAEFGAYEVLTLPKIDKMILQLRDVQIRADHAGGRGKSIPELAGLYGLTTRHILNVLAKGSPSEAAPAHQVEQLQLF